MPELPLKANFPPSPRARISPASGWSIKLLAQKKEFEVNSRPTAKSGLLQGLGRRNDGVDMAGYLHLSPDVPDHSFRIDKEGCPFHAHVLPAV